MSDSPDIPAALAWAAFRPDGEVCVSTISEDLEYVQRLVNSLCVYSPGWTVRRVEIREVKEG